MAVSSKPLILQTVTLDTGEAVPLYRQLYDGLRTAILSGELPPGTRLPSTRALADALEISRNTVVGAFDQLTAEGYLEARVGAGTFVSDDLPDELLTVRGQREETLRTAPPKAPPAALSRRGALIAGLDLSRLRDPEKPRAFRPGLPALDAFPIDEWSRLASRRWRYTAPEQLTYGEAAGYRPLREAIASYLCEARGVRCTADQVIIVSGTLQAVDLTARVLLNPGDTVWMEDPGYPRLRGALHAADLRPVPVPIDDDGLDLRAGRKRAPNVRLAYMTPSHQYPIGVTMSLSRRLEFLDWARHAGAWILEDDYDSEYRYTGQPLAALQGLDDTGRVIYIGTFSKVLFPALRLGYLVIPRGLIAAFSAARTLIDRCPPLISQMALTDFIQKDYFVRHLRRMRTLYAARQAALVQAAEEHLDDWIDISPDPAGLHVVGWLPDGIDDQALSERLEAEGIVAPPLSFYSAENLSREGLVLGYAAIDEEEIRDGVLQMRAVLESFSESSF